MKFIHSINNNPAVKIGLFVRLESKPGKETDVENFLRSGLALIEEEPATTLWFAIRLGVSTFAIFDAFANQEGRDAHLAGKVAAALFAKTPELFAQAPVVEKFETLASRLPA